ncbi:hypothetical protein Xmir_03441 [Xenorhabdus miraniensis]|uniref:Uncharacterized protein n=1 Tax=Xenorhabdus miraniensis TaxID=351674 RepID=A0A2D0JLP2_9GAMM|nr:hypothetical protein Xmir_03441 [Xenorhabdus miraniensis]
MGKRDCYELKILHKKKPLKGAERQGWCLWQGKPLLMLLVHQSTSKKLVHS